MLLVVLKRKLSFHLFAHILQSHMHALLLFRKHSLFNLLFSCLDWCSCLVGRVFFPSSSSSRFRSSCFKISKSFRQTTKCHGIAQSDSPTIFSAHESAWAESLFVHMKSNLDNLKRYSFLFSGAEESKRNLLIWNSFNRKWAREEKNFTFDSHFLPSSKLKARREINNDKRRTNGRSNSKRRISYAKRTKTRKRKE